MKVCRGLRFAAAAALALVLAMPVVAQERPAVGVALSGGAARGFAHVGVLKVLQEAGVPIDYVSGTSMGAVIGGLYAAGYSVAEIESLSVHIDWDDLFSDAVGRGKLAMEYKRWDARYAMTFPMAGWSINLPSGLIAGQKISKQLSRLTFQVDHIADFSRLPTPFVCTATDIVNGDVVVLDHGRLADAIRASMSIPTIFTPVVIDGRLLVDGGVMRNLPAVEVINMGADIVIGVNADEPLYKRGELNSMLRILDQTVHFQIAGTSKEQKGLCDVLIVPESPDKQGFQFNEAAYFIARGEAAARAMMPRLRALADSLAALRGPAARWIPERSDSLLITAVFVEGLDRIPTRVVETALEITPPLRMTVDDVEDAIDHVYKYDYFQRVEYSVAPSDTGQHLTVRLVEKSGNEFRAGLRYDTYTDVALLANFTGRDVGVRGGVLAFDVRLGPDLGGDLRYFTPVGRTLESFGLSGRLNSSWRRFNVYVGDDRDAVYRTTYTFGELLAGTIFASRWTLAGGARAEYIETKFDSGAEVFPNQYDKMFPVFGALRIDTINRTMFPRSGVFVDARGEATSANVGSDLTVSRYYVDWRLYVPVHSRLSLFQTLYLGTTPVGDPPPAYLFTLGGIAQPFTWLGPPNSFIGFKWQELTGPHAQTLGLGVQWEFYQRLYAIGRWNFGNVFQDWNSDIAWDDYEHGGGITLGLNVPAVPIEFTVSRSTRHNFLAQFTLGYWF